MLFISKPRVSHCVCVKIQLVQPGQIQLQGGQTLQLQGQQGQPQQIIIQQPQTAITAGQNQVLHFARKGFLLFCCSFVPNSCSLFY